MDALLEIYGYCVLIKLVNSMATAYLQELLDFYIPDSSLRSGDMQLLKTQSYNLRSYGFRAFSILCPPGFGIPSHWS